MSLVVVFPSGVNPNTGRFLTTDPVPGGNPNPYTYPVDPINGYDLSGTFGWGSFFHAVAAVCLAVIAAPIAPLIFAWHYTPQNYRNNIVRTAKSAWHATAAAVRHPTRRNIGRAATAVGAAATAVQIGAGITGDPVVEGVAAGVGTAAGIAGLGADLADPHPNALVITTDVVALAFGLGGLGASWKVWRFASMSEEGVRTTKVVTTGAGGAFSVPGWTNSLGGSG